ncbi:hypothetical protein GCM10028792_15380 [Salinisphaera aquimarina]
MTRAALGELCCEFGGRNFIRAMCKEDRSVLWAARHAAAYALNRLRLSKEFHATENQAESR